VKTRAARAGATLVALGVGLGLAVAPTPAQAAPVRIELADPAKTWFNGRLFVETSAPATALACSWRSGDSAPAPCTATGRGAQQPYAVWALQVDAPDSTPQGALVTVDVTATSASGGEQSSNSFTLRWDTVAPIGRTSTALLYGEGNAKVQTWATGDPAVDGWYSGVGPVTRVLFAKGISASGFTAHSFTQDAPTSGRHAATLAPGTTACGFLVVADRAENVLRVPYDQLADGAAFPTCTAAPLDDRALAGGWIRAANASAANGSVSSTGTRGATLAYPAVTTEIITVKAYRCSSCGSFEVRLDGQRVARYSLRSATRGWLTVGFSAGSLRSGRLTLVALGDGPVSVDLVWAYTPLRS